MNPQNPNESNDYNLPSQGGRTVDDSQTVQSYASGVSDYRLESLENALEVHTEQQPVQSGHPQPKKHLRFSTFFSRRKAMIVSTLITALVLMITIGAMAFLVRKGPSDDKSSQTAVQQDVKIEDSNDSKIPNELQGAQQSLLVSGDIITRGSLKISDGGFMTVIRVQNPTANQTVTLPGTSGTICLDTNNCGYASQDTADALQGQSDSLQSQVNDLNALVQSLGQVTIPPAGVTELNGQTGSVSLQGSVNRINVATTNGVVTITTPQDLDANANVQFGSLSLSPSGQIRANTLVQTAAGNSVSINAGNDSITFVAGGRVFSLPATGGAVQTICTTGATCATGSGTAVILSPGTAQVDGTADSSIFINDTGGGNLIHMQSGGVDRFTISNNGNTTVGGSLTISGLGNGFVRSTGGTLGVVTAIDLTTDVAGTLPIANGGTGSNTAGGARGNLGAAASGANGDITSTTALNTITPSAALTVGAPSQQFTLQGASNSSISAGSGANITTLAFAAPSGSSTITFPALTGTVCVSTGNCAAAGTAGGDLTGSYPNPTIARLQGANLNITGSSNGQILIYNSANTRWENTSVSGDATISGLGVVTIANNAITTSKIADGNVTTAKVADGNITNVKLQNSSLTVTSGAGLINGGSVSLGSSLTLNIGQGDGITVNADDIAVDNTVCRTTGNCAGVGGNGDISGTGGNGRIALFNGAKTLTSSTLLQSAGALTLDSGNNFVLTSGNLVLSNGNVDVTGGGNFSGTVSGADATQNDEFVTLSQLNAAIGGVGGGVDSLNTLAGDLSLQGTAGQITISSNGTDTLTLSLNSAVTLQGNTFNGVNQLVRLGASGELPVLDGSNLTNLNASNLASGTVPSGRLSGSYTGITGLGTVTTGTWNGNAIADAYIQDNITISSSGTVDWTALNNYPAACPAGQAITQLGDTITCTTFAAGSGSGNYIQNQNASAQAANFWINGDGIINGSASVGVSLLSPNIQTEIISETSIGADIEIHNSTGQIILDAFNGVELIGNVNASGSITATSFSGNGSGLTSLNASNISSGTLSVARIADGSLTNAKLQNSSLTVTAGGGLINGGSIALGGSATLNIGQGDGITVNADDIAVDNTVCRTTGNCAGVGGTGDISGSGTANRIALFNGAKNIVNSYLLQSAGTLTLDNGVDFVLAGGDINVTGAGTFTGTVSGADATQNDEFVTLAQLNAATGGGGSGVASLNSLSGALTLQGTTGQITVNDNGSNTITLALGADVTLQGNVFNGSDQLVQLNNTGALPVLDGSNLTNVDAALLQGQNGAYYLDLGNATGTLNIARIADASITNTKLVNDSITISAGNGLTGGGTTALGGTNTLNIGAGSGITVNANDVAVDATVARLNANANFTASLQQGGNDVCTTAGNCAGVGGVGDISGSGTNNRIAMFNGTKTLTSSTLLQSAGTLTLDTGNNFVLTAGNLTLSSGDLNVTGAGTFSGTVTATDFSGSGASLTSLNASQLTSGTVASARISGSYTGITGVGTVTVGTWNGTAISDAYIQDNVTISSAGTVDWTALSNYPAACPAGSAITQLGDTITCQAFATGGDGGVTTIGAIDSQTKSANGAVISGVNLYLQTADASNPGLVSTGNQTFAGNKTFNGSVVLAASQSLTITGGNTASRPASPTEGMLYFDTTTKQLLVYANGKWQADRSTATKIVAASNAPQSVKDAADYVANGSTDEAVINAALTAATGGKVYLTEGTYTTAGTILVPNDTTLEGAGKNSTVIRLSVGATVDNLIENSNTSSAQGVSLRNMTLSGVFTTGVQHAIHLVSSSANPNNDLSNIGISGWTGSTVYLDGIQLNSIVSSTTSGAVVLINGAIVSKFSNTTAGSMSLNGSQIDSFNNNIVNGDVSLSNNSGIIGFDGNYINGRVTLNSSAIVQFADNTTSELYITSPTTLGVPMTVSGNTIITSNASLDAINLVDADSVRIIGNTIVDGAGTSGYAININATTDGAYIADNNLGGLGINDLGTNTTYGGQTNASGNFMIQPAGSGTIELMKNTNVTGTLNVSSNLDTNGSLTVGNANQFVISNTGVVTSGTWNGSVLTDAYVSDTLTISNAGTVDWQALNNYPAACPAGQAITQLGDTITCAVFAAGSGSGNYIQNQNASAQAASFWINGSGRVNGDFSAGGVLYTDEIDVLTSGIGLKIGDNAAGITFGSSGVGSVFNGEVTIASSMTLTITGGNTGSRPAGSEGMIYFDTTTKKLLVYSNGKWQADRSDAILVAASNSSQSDKDAADYVANGNTGAAADGDQVEINQALTAASGKKVVLLAGTYTIDAAVSVPNNTVISGVGQGTIITIPNSFNTNINALSLGNNVTVRDMQLDGNLSNQTSGTMYGVYLNASTGTKATNVASNNWRNAGFLFATANGNTVTNSIAQGNGSMGISLSGSSDNILTDNLLQNNVSYGIYMTGVDPTISGRNTVSGNNISGGATGIYIYTDSVPANNNITGNVVQGSTSAGISLNTATSNLISGNSVHDSGGVSLNQAILLIGSGGNTISSNLITDTSATGTNSAIVLTAVSTANYLADNSLGGGSISDNTPTSNTYGGQANASGNFMIQPAGSGTIELMKNTNVTGTLNITSDVDTNGSLTVGNANQFVISNTGVVTSGTWNGTALIDAYVSDTLTISSAGTVDWQALSNYPAACPAGQAVTQLGDSITCAAFAAGSGSGNYIQNQNASQQTTANFWISGTGRADTSFTTPLLDTATAVALNIGTTNATQINLNKNVVVAASQSLTITGGNTASRPVSPTEGMLYFDTTTKQLLVYANGKWQADRTEAVIVAASDSSQTDKDAADYVANGNTGAAADGDQVEINQALTAASGKKVVLLAGTYTIDASISVPNNTTLTGVGSNTLITIQNTFNTSIDAITNTTTGGNGTGIVIQNLRLDGNTTNQSSGTMRGIYLNGVGSGNTGTAVQGAKLTDLWVNNWRTSNMSLNSTANSYVSDISMKNAVSGSVVSLMIDGTSINNTFTDNEILGGTHGIYIVTSTSSNNTFTSNIVDSTNNKGIYVSSGYNNFTGNTVRNVNGDGFFLETATASNNNITGNTIQSNNEGIHTTGNASQNLISGNNIVSNSVYGIEINGGSANIVSSNKFHSNGGNTTNNAIYIPNSSSNSIVGNSINDTSATTNNYAINLGVSSSSNYIAGNTLGGGSINDASSTNIYGGQVNSSTNYVVQPAGTIELMKNTNVTGTLNITSDVDTNGSLTVGNANQFVISNTGVVTSGTWQAGTIGLLYGGTNNTSYTTNGIVYSNGTSLVSTGAGTTGQCLIATTGGAPSWTSCTATTLQGAYDASSPATILLADNKNLQFTAADTATDPSIIMKLNCTACGTGATGNFLVQNNGGTALFSIAGNGDIQLGTATNGISLSSAVNGGAFTLSGNAQNTKRINLIAEYPSVVLDPDLTNNTGTMTSGYDSASRMNYYKWTTTQGTNQDYDIVVQVPVPSDFASWANSNLVTVSAYTTDATNGTISITAIDTAGTTICNNISVTPTAGYNAGLWRAPSTACALSSGTYTPGAYMTFRIKLQSPNGGDTRVGNIYLDYKSKF